MQAVAADDGIAPNLHPKRPQVFHEERRVDFAGGGGDMQPSSPQVRQSAGQSVDGAACLAGEGELHEHLRRTPPKHNQGESKPSTALRNSSQGLSGLFNFFFPRHLHFLVCFWMFVELIKMHGHTASAPYLNRVSFHIIF